MRILLRFGGETLGLPPCTEGIGELGDGENPLGMLLLAFLFGHARKEAQLVLLESDLATSRFEFTLGTMFVENERWWCVTCLLCGNLADDSLGHVHQSSHIDFCSSLLTAMYDLPEKRRLARNGP